MEALVPAILEQKVVILEAHRAWRILLSKFGAAPPGPAPPGMRVFPEPGTWRRIPSWEWHRAGVEGVRAETIIRAATVAGSLERLLEVGHEEADRKLRTIPGIGVWTSAEARQRAAGDPDAVSVGDYHLKNVVGWALAGKDRSSDEEMLALLEPFKGHRHRATRLIGLSGGARPARTAGAGAGAGTGTVRYGAGRPPRRGPRMSVRDYRKF
jgi:3-methyladenine DNA glycosylase/8-oxoguanine DNA glycosylase